MENKTLPQNWNQDDLDAFRSFSIGRTNFYWKYVNGVPFCQKKEFTDENLCHHILGTKTFGFSMFMEGDNDNVMFGAIDFDAHRDDGDTDEIYAEKERVAQDEAKQVYEYLKSFKLPVILNSSGSSGRHVRYYCNGAPAKNIRMYLKYVLFTLFGDPNRHEVFPKQDNLSDEKPYGNQIKGLLCIHPKHKKRANVMAGEKILDIQDSLKVMKMALENAGNMPRFSEEDYKKIEVLNQSHGYIEKYNTEEHALLLQDVPDYCAFFEEVATKYSLPSKDKYSRHFCLDSNMAAYGITHPKTKVAYANAQGRTSHTAFDNWKKYWKDGKAEFSCSTIIAYLREHSRHGNTNSFRGLQKCLDCKRFKDFMEKQKGPSRDWHSFLDITKVAAQEGITVCPKCNNSLEFESTKRFFSCETCKLRGGVKKLLFLKFKYKKKDK